MRKQLKVLKELKGDLSLIETENYEKLISCIDKIIESNKIDGVLYYQKGVIYFQKDDYQKAIEYFTKALNYDVGISYKAVGNFQAALEQFNKSLEIQSKNTKIAILKSDTLRLMKRFNEAEVMLNELYQNERENVQVIQGLIELKLDQDLISDVSLYIQQIDSLKVIDVEPLFQIVQRLTQSKLEQEALKVLRKIVQYDNKNIEAWYSQGIILYNGDQFTEALKSFEKVIELDSQNTSAMLYLALSFRQLNKFQDAIQIFDKLLQINPKDAAIWNNKGITFRELKQFQKALTCFDEALSINPKNPLYKINKAKIIIQNNKLEGLKLLQEAKDSFNVDLENNQVFTSINIQYMQEQFELLEQSGKGSNFFDQFEMSQTNYMENSIVQVPNEQIQSQILILQDQKKDQDKVRDKVRDKDINLTCIQQSCLIQGSNSNLSQLENTIIGGQQGILKKKNTKFKIEQLEDFYKQLEKKINKIQEQIQTVGIDKRAAIIKQIQEFQKSAEGLNQLAYYKAFFWTFFNYTQAYANQSTGLYQHNTNQTIETTAEKVVDNLETGLGIGVKITASVPLVNTILSAVHSAIQTLFIAYKDNKHQDRIDVINEVIQKKVIGLSDLELQISIAALDLSIKKLDIIKDLEKYERKKPKTFTQEMEKIMQRMMDSKSSLFQGGASQIGLEDALYCLGYYYQNGLVDEDQDLSQQIVQIIIEKRPVKLKTEISETKDCYSWSCQMQ